MNNTKIQTLTVEEGSRIRDFITKMKKKYLDSPTYVEADWETEIHELDDKHLHCDWWQELTGDWDEVTGCAQTYFSLIEDELEIVAGRVKDSDEPWLVEHVLRELVEEFAIAEAEEVWLFNLDTELKEQLRQHINSFPIAVLMEMFMAWVRTQCVSDVGSFSIELGDETAPVQLVWDRLLNYIRCENRQFP